ncbi:MAG: HD domain-containing protein, partial [Oscillospiraceae bacterium]|nr:HD domain-containing protein [Oscillospiraceae bacterium]
MRKSEYELIESYMLECMNDSAHDKEHIYRVLYGALDIAEYESGVDYDILTAACLLHDIGRAEQFADPKLCHAEVGSEKAHRFLLKLGWSMERANHVKDCIKTHRFRSDCPPESIEAKILFDSDKLDVAGAIGVARTLFYKGQVGEPLYRLNSGGTVSDGSADKEPSFFREYKFKLENLYGKFFTDHGRELAPGSYTHMTLPTHSRG